MSVKNDSTKLPEDDCGDSGFLSGPLSGPLTTSEESGEHLYRDGGSKRSYTESTQLDSGLDLTISEDLSNIKISDRGLLDEHTGATLLDISQPLVNITEVRDTDIPPLAILFQQDDDGDT